MRYNYYILCNMVVWVYFLPVVQYFGDLLWWAIERKNGGMSKQYAYLMCNYQAWTFNQSKKKQWINIWCTFLTTYNNVQVYLTIWMLLCCTCYPPHSRLSTWTLLAVLPVRKSLEKSVGPTPKVQYFHWLVSWSELIFLAYMRLGPFWDLQGGGIQA